jgi:CRISPR/Cas system-associated exonuclease Cas4 (RecB family)
VIINAVTRADAQLINDVAEQVFDLEAAYVNWVETEPRDDRQGHFHPSAVGGCARRNVYEYIRAPRMFMDKPADMEIFRIGHAVHHIVQTILADLGRVLTPRGIEYSFYPEIPYDPATDLLYNDLGIGGTCDGLLELRHTRLGWTQRGVVEIKTIKNEKFNQLKAPKEEHQMQANLYAFRFDTPIIWYWYYNKDNSQRRVFKTRASDEYLDKALARFVEQKAHVDAGTLPDREESFWMCPRCEYGHICQPSKLKRVQEQEKLIQVRTNGFGARKKAKVSNGT